MPDLRRLPPDRGATVEVSEPGYLLVDTYDILRQHVVSHHVRFDESRQARLGRSPHRYVWPAELDLMGAAGGLRAGVAARRLVGRGVHRDLGLARLGLPAGRP